MESVLMVGCDLHDRNGLCKVAVGRGDPAVWRFPNNGAGRAGLTIRLKDWAEKQKANRIVFT